MLPEAAKALCVLYPQLVSYGFPMSSTLGIKAVALQQRSTILFHLTTLYLPHNHCLLFTMFSSTTYIALLSAVMSMTPTIEGKAITLQPTLHPRFEVSPQNPQLC